MSFCICLHTDTLVKSMVQFFYLPKKTQLPTIQHTRSIFCFVSLFSMYNRIQFTFTSHRLKVFSFGIMYTHSTCIWISEHCLYGDEINTKANKSDKFSLIRCFRWQHIGVERKKCRKWNIEKKREVYLLCVSNIKCWHPKDRCRCL